MKTNILYILENPSGIAKVGISEDFESRIKSINETLGENNKFKVVCKINVIENPAIVEAFIHEFLSMRQKNLVYLKEKKIIDYDGLVESTNSGYTEYFLSDKESIKQCVSIFGVLGLLDVKEKELIQIDKMKGFDFDELIELFPELLVQCSNNNISVFKDEQFIENKNLSIEYLQEKIKNKEKFNIDFGVLGGQFILKVDNFTIKTNDFFSEKNKLIINCLLENQENISSSIKTWKDLYPILKKLMLETKKHGYSQNKGLISLNKEISKNKFNDFLSGDGLKNIKEYFYNFEKKFMCESASEDLLFGNKRFTSEFLSKFNLPKSKKQKYINIVENYSELNFNSTELCGKFFRNIDKLHADNMLRDYEYLNLFDTGQIVQSILKNIYDSKGTKNKEKAVSDALDILNFIDENYCKWDIKNCNILLEKCKDNNELINIAKHQLKLFYGDKINSINDVRKVDINKI